MSEEQRLRETIAHLERIIDEQTKRIRELIALLNGKTLDDLNTEEGT